MTDRQQKFADEYIIDCNATRAYKVAYPNVKKESTAASNGSKLLRNTKVAAYIEEKLTEEAAFKDGAPPHTPVRVFLKGERKTGGELYKSKIFP